MFDSKQELLDKIRLGEDSVLELKTVTFKGQKVDGPGRSELADELAALANSNGGVLVLGVDDVTREILGIPLDRLDTIEALVREVCNDSIQPSLTAEIIRMELPDSGGTNRAIIKVDVPQSLFVHKTSHGYFRRLGSSKREMPTDLLIRLGQQRSQTRIIRFEEQPVPNTTVADLSVPLYERFTSRSNEPGETVLLKRNLLRRDESGNIRASVAGVLMCSEFPDKHLTGAFIEAVRYRGKLQDSNYQHDAQQIRGPLDEQIRQAMLFLKRNQTIAANKEPHRIEKPQFSERAVFEAVVNAVAHRDYSIYGSKIRFFIFDDRLELYSPGALPNTVTVESLPLRQATRNELITSLLAECPVPGVAGNVQRTYYMEKRGDGVPIIIRESEGLSGRRPEYRLIDDSELLLTIFAAAS
ncbi:MAG: putative DNA binding domain-containing protein [Verrucomicrobia bacterium]|nr:putative DNA binding domain-containing protein [Verrucomicrobiota bacterium]